MKKFVAIVFYGNIFYSLCAVALCFETNLQHNLTVNRFPFYLLIFFCTWIYYTRIYYRSTAAKIPNERTEFYRINKKRIRSLLISVLILLTTFILLLLGLNFSKLQALTYLQWLLILVFPVIGALYTIPFPYLKKIREIIWLKPFIIGLTWSGVVTVYPVIVAEVQSLSGEVVYPSFLYFLHNFLFISNLALIFDIKDHAADTIQKFKTYPTLLGVKNTIQWVVVPLAIINIITFTVYHNQTNTSSAGIILQAMPFALLFIILTQLPRMNKILQYLVIVDGLMLLKALLGIISVTIFKSE